ncbi:MAG: BrnT family toxin [Desulfamplus sp.]|nr:BrnT family toxin [Desulfamplus sp.]
MNFEWDTVKNQTNLQKHGVDFEEAKSIFDDIFAIIIEDRFHSLLEQREIIVGQSINNRLLYVVFVDKGDCIRIISARKLSSIERRRYEQGKLS